MCNILIAGPEAGDGQGWEGEGAGGPLQPEHEPDAGGAPGADTGDKKYYIILYKSDITKMGTCCSSSEPEKQLDFGSNLEGSSKTASLRQLVAPSPRDYQFGRISQVQRLPRDMTFGLNKQNYKVTETSGQEEIHF